MASAKQRYNKRVLAGIKAFLSLDARDLSQVGAFFASSEEGGWEDFSSAGYLLANAFRTSSTKAPDNLPSVKVSGFTCLCFSRNILIDKIYIAIRELCRKSCRNQTFFITSHSTIACPFLCQPYKKWKAYAKDMDLVNRSLSKKDGEKTFAAYQSAEQKLDAYLDAVELPSVMELKSE